MTSKAPYHLLGKGSYLKKPWLKKETLQTVEQGWRARLLGDMTTHQKHNGVQNRLFHQDQTQFVARKTHEIKLATKKKDVGSLFSHL